MRLATRAAEPGDGCQEAAGPDLIPTDGLAYGLVRLVACLCSLVPEPHTEPRSLLRLAVDGLGAYQVVSGAAICACEGWILLAQVLAEADPLLHTLLEGVSICLVWHTCSGVT